jgi:hypothetical protein
MELLTKYVALIPGMKVKPPKGKCEDPSLHNHLAATGFRLTEFHFKADSSVIYKMNYLCWSLDMNDKVTELAFNHLHDLSVESEPEQKEGSSWKNTLDWNLRAVTVVVSILLWLAFSTYVISDMLR